MSMIRRSKIHWMTRRVIDPVGKLLDDLHYLDFRRNLLTCMSKENGEVRFCVHSECSDALSHVQFPSELGKFDILEVVDKDDAQKHGSWAYLCFCKIAEKDASARLEVGSKPSVLAQRER